MIGICRLESQQFYYYLETRYILSFVNCVTGGIATNLISILWLLSGTPPKNSPDPLFHFQIRIQLHSKLYCPQFGRNSYIFVLLRYLIFSIEFSFSMWAGFVISSTILSFGSLISPFPRRIHTICFAHLSRFWRIREVTLFVMASFLCRCVHFRIILFGLLHPWNGLSAPNLSLHRIYLYHSF